MLRARRTSWREPMPGAPKKRAAGEKPRRLGNPTRLSDRFDAASTVTVNGVLERTDSGPFGFADRWSVTSVLPSR